MSTITLKCLISTEEGSEELHVATLNNSGYFRDIAQQSLVVLGYSLDAIYMSKGSLIFEYVSIIFSLDWFYQSHIYKHLNLINKSTKIGWNVN